jgi:hypothetical protein
MGDRPETKISDCLWKTGQLESGEQVWDRDISADTS